MSSTVLHWEFTFASVPQAYEYKSERKYTKLPAVEFFVNNTRGIRLLDASKGNFAGLADPDSQVMEEHGEKVSYLFEWPGYKTVKKQMNARRRKGGAVQTRSRVAQQVATIVERFIDEESDCVPSIHGWRVGPGYVEFDSVYLIALKRISKGTWVAELAFSMQCYILRNHETTSYSPTLSVLLACCVRTIRSSEQSLRLWRLDV
ncbi:hypothetical protein BDY19DRAFT_907941 [Irpex rosettiformis]|uniref:Uncharacterized protein n=1 Tax=Irpex rosettiformis TaxID=378272 RepID=A0ACB8TXL4_9APHY|nr:hypothetical protein BDY19DRAFT_907941 [Irpex rosettiformis]